MTKLKTILISIMFIQITNAAEMSVVFPGSSKADVSAIEGYMAPYQKFGEVGFFAEDKRLQYSIAYDILDKGKFDLFKAENEKNPLEFLMLLSENHWIALNKRNLKVAQNISKEMKKVLEGSYGIQQVSLPMDVAHRVISLKYRCLEQIAMSMDDLGYNLGGAQDELYKRNMQELSGLNQLALKVTSTPFFCSDVAYDFSNKYGVPENPHLVVPILYSQHAFVESNLNDITASFSEQKDLILTAYQLKKTAYNDYLEHVYNTMGKIKYSNCRSVERGETSESSRDTCMFNSVFHYDHKNGNIRSTKNGSIEKGKGYITHLEKIYHDKLRTQPEIQQTLTQIKQQFDRMQRNRSAEAMYSYCSSLKDNRIFPGFLSQVSELEVQCHSLMLNFIIFLKSTTNTSPSEFLFSRYAIGYYGSENFSISPVSSSTRHAQGLVLT